MRTNNNYSYRKASIGCNFAAFCAGYQPNTTPITPDTPIARATAETEIVKGKLITAEIIKEITTPKSIPKAPPAKVKIIDSIKN
ncbi:hypothetical protein A3F03_01130 [Candidatus Roizmanbacteria bacterium RIFCSPHIGHO2_12_FULL_41_11]|uniref:Uncharacterized protein n=2 Tax=Candidatus Roizmaniibacteriota TaxID=1752723 RepID=A0A1F7JR31_9BACT|nr:MAG: hypothetical protein A3F03_01130 [Candidatus Roizmanbacteria bacterium RIFCSPHIGHO2_12_FULL_41_11]OGK58072.1 MAG: hypothetical protein A3H86_02635 [Candidatus Roizmanbacteria bacterium RIFCSPLOWO2_02_FULL_41_9]